jgi:hypothetical protein
LILLKKRFFRKNSESTFFRWRQWRQWRQQLKCASAKGFEIALLSPSHFFRWRQWRQRRVAVSTVSIAFLLDGDSKLVLKTRRCALYSHCLHCLHCLHPKNVLWEFFLKKRFFNNIDVLLNVRSIDNWLEIHSSHLRNVDRSLASLPHQSNLLNLQPHLASYNHESKTALHFFGLGSLLPYSSKTKWGCKRVSIPP